MKTPTEHDNYKTQKCSTFCYSITCQKAKKLSASGGLRPPDPLTRGSASGPRWGLCPQTPDIRLALPRSPCIRAVPLFLSFRRLWSSEALAAEEMTFEAFTNVSVDRVEVRSSTGGCSMLPGPTRQSLADLVRVRGTTSVPLYADRSCHLPTTYETGIHTSAT